MERKTLEEDLTWVFQNGVVCMVDHVIESEEFALGIQVVKVTCVVASMESGKEVE